MATNKEKKLAKEKTVGKDDLYHDIEQEKKKKMDNSEYEELLTDLEIELVKLQEWVKANKLKVVIVFEGRDAAGKGGVIKTIAGCLNPRICRIVALGIPCLLYTSPSPRDRTRSRMPSSA